MKQINEMKELLVKKYNHAKGLPDDGVITDEKGTN